MNWQEISGNWVYIPRQPRGVIHFLGGAFVAAAPHLTYRLLLEELGKQGYATMWRSLHNLVCPILLIIIDRSNVEPPRQMPHLKNE